MSVKSKAIVKAIRLCAKMNPDLTPHPISRVESLNKHSKWHYRHSSALTVKKETTESGVGFLHITLNQSKAAEPQSGKALFYVHGGVFIADLHPFYINAAERIMRATGCAEAILPDYRTLPDHAYPTQLNDVKEVWDRCTADFSPKNIIVSGDSAGGNLALALLLTLRDESKEMPRGGVFFSPWLDMLCTGESYFFNYERDAMFGNKKVGTHEERRKRLIESEIFSYAKAVSEEERKHPYLSPVYGEYHGMPPMFFSVGEDEMLRSDTETAVKKLKAENVTVQQEMGAGMFHIYALFPVLPEAGKAYKALQDFSEKYF